jgi:hypothetical protein
MTRTLGIISEEHILSAVRPGKRYIFEYFLSFDHKIWINIILSLIIFSLIMSLTQRSFKNVLSNFWLFSTVLLSDIFPKRMLTKNLIERIIICSWLLFCTVILSAFSGVLYGFLIKNIPNDVINLWEDLYSRKEFKITASYSDLQNSESDEMVQDFKSRTDEKIFTSQEFDTEFLSICEKIKRSNRVFFGSKILLESMLAEYGENSMHVSKYGGEISPYVLAINKLIDSQLESQLNNM